MTENARLTGMFHGINFGIKRTKESFDQAVGMHFVVGLDETSLPAVMKLVPWQKQEVVLEVSRRQAALFEPTEPEVQPSLPVAAAPPAPDHAAEGTPRKIEAVTTRTWIARTVQGPDDLPVGVLVRADGQGFYCLDCGDTFFLEPEDILDEEIAIHRKGCGEEPTRTCRVCGCTEQHACPEGCSWVEIDLCSNPDCLASAGYAQEEIVAIVEGNTPMIWLDRGGDVEVRGADGATRKFNVEIRNDRIEGLSCDACNEHLVPREWNRNNKAAPPADDLYGLMRGHRCPSLCHKCRAKERHGDALAELLLYHHPNCENAGQDPLPIDADAALKEKPYAQRILEAFALDPKGYMSYDAEHNHVTAFILEDPAESIARIEDLAGLEPAKLRPETYAERWILQGYSSKSVLAGVKKAVKEFKDRVLVKRLNTLLDDIKETQKNLKEAQAELNKKQQTSEDDEPEEDEDTGLQAAEPISE